MPSHSWYLTQHSRGHLYLSTLLPQHGRQAEIIFRFIFHGHSHIGGVYPGSIPLSGYPTGDHGTQRRSHGRVDDLYYRGRTYPKFMRCGRSREYLFSHHRDHLCHLHGHDLKMQNSIQGGLAANNCYRRYFYEKFGHHKLTFHAKTGRWVFSKVFPVNLVHWPVVFEVR